MNRIYLDWNATAPLLPEVRDAMVEALDSTWGNASSIHHDGQAARSVVERARRAVAKAVGAPPQAVILTGGATESNNQVLRHHVRVTENPHIVCTSVEHPSVLAVAEDMAREGTRISVWPVDDRGRLNASFLHQVESPTLVSTMWANNETGNVYRVAEIAQVAHELEALVHVDGTQALGRVHLDFAAADVDLMTLSFHKMGGPKGIGAIVVKEGQKVDALLAGGHQERGRRPGTENVPAAAGLIAAMNALSRNREAWTADMKEKRAALLESLEALADTPFEVRGDTTDHLPNTLNLAFEGVDGEDLLVALDLAGVSMSSGSACTAGSLEPSHVVLAMGYDEESARRSVRLSFGPTTSLGELSEAATRIAENVDRLASI